MFPRFAIFSLIFLSSPARAQDHAVANATFVDDSLHYTLEYPGELQRLKTDVPIPATQVPNLSADRTKSILACTKPSLAAIQRLPPLFNMLIVMTLDLSCARETLTKDSLPSFTQGMVTQALARHGKPTFGNSYPYKLDRFNAYYQEATVDESARKEGQVLFAGSVCSLVEKSAVCWVALSYEKRTIEKILREPITFANRPTQTLLQPKS